MSVSLGIGEQSFDRLDDFAVGLTPGSINGQAPLERGLSLGDGALKHSRASQLAFRIGITGMVATPAFEPH